MMTGGRVFSLINKVVQVVAGMSANFYGQSFVGIPDAPGRLQEVDFDLLLEALNPEAHTFAVEYYSKYPESIFTPFDEAKPEAGPETGQMQVFFNTLCDKGLLVREGYFQYSWGEDAVEVYDALEVDCQIIIADREEE